MAHGSKCARPLFSTCVVYNQSHTTQFLAHSKFSTIFPDSIWTHFSFCCKIILLRCSFGQSLLRKQFQWVLVELINCRLLRSGIQGSLIVYVVAADLFPNIFPHMNHLSMPILSLLYIFLCNYYSEVSSFKNLVFLIKPISKAVCLIMSFPIFIQGG